MTALSAGTLCGLMATPALHGYDWHSLQESAKSPVAPHIAMGLWNSGAKWAAVAIPSTNSAPALTGSCNFAQLGRFYPVAMMRRMSAICAFETFGPTSRIDGFR